MRLMSLGNRRGEQVLDAEIADMPITADLPPALQARSGLLSQIQQAGRRNGLVDLVRTLIDPVNPDQWMEAQLQGMTSQELLGELIAMERMFERISQSLRKRVAWFRSRIEGVVDEKELHTTVDCRVDHFLREWIERLEDDDFAKIMTELESSESLPIGDRLKLAERCYHDLCELVRLKEIHTEDWDTIRHDEDRVKRERLLPDALDDLRWGTQLTEQVKRGRREVWRSHRATTDIMESIRHIRQEAQLRSDIGSVDSAELEANARSYGAKGANLLAARKAVAGLNKARIYTRVRVPPFQLLDVEIFERWKRGEDITDVLAAAHRKIGGKAMYVRSSAVHSEDRENLTGAGIYDSVPLAKGASLDEFRAAVEQVYRSTDAPKAVEYRALNNLDVPEQMGVVVQEMVPRRLAEYRKGYINTVRPHAPGLLEVVVEDHQLRVICKKDAIERQMWRGDHHLEHIAYYQIDAHRHTGAQNTMASLAHIGQMLEMHFGYPVQIEFISGDRDANLLQVRHLPSQLLSSASVKFPEDKQPLHESDAIGVGDMMLDVLPPQRSNAERKGVVIFYRSYGMSEQYIEQYLPKEGAVIILCPSRENFGHIETLCVERGLLCVFQSGSGGAERGEDNEMSPALRTMLSQASNRFSEITRYDDFAGHRKLHIVADGLRAKIYPAESQEQQ